MAINKIRRQKGTVYRVRVPVPNGKVISQCFARRIDAEQFAAKVKMNSRVAAQEKIRFAEFSMKFIELCAKPNLEDSSVQRYESVIRNYFNPRFGRYFLKDITKHLLFEFKAEVQQMKSSGSQKYFLISSLKTMFRRAVELDYLERSPATGLTAPRKGLPKTDYWSQDEAQKFIAHSHGSPRFPLYMIALNTGMRLGELYGLKWDCVDFNNGLLTVRRIWCQKIDEVKESTKTHSIRTFKMNRLLTKYLAELKLSSNSEMVLDPRAMKCINPAHVARSFATDSQRAGVRVIKFHDIRHTFATQFVRNNGSIHALAGVLGHTSTAMTDRYAHFSAEHAAAVAEIVTFAPPARDNVLDFIGHKADTNALTAT